MAREKKRGNETMNYTFYLVLQLYRDGSTLYQYAEQADALKRYQKCVRAILYELVVGTNPSLREVLKMESDEEQGEGEL